MAAPGTVANCTRRTLLPISNSSCSGIVSLDSASCRIGTLEALYDRMNGGAVPGGEFSSWVCETAVICAKDSAVSTLGWKKYLTTAVLLTDCDSVCSTSLT